MDILFIFFLTELGSQSDRRRGPESTRLRIFEYQPAPYFNDLRRLVNRQFIPPDERTFLVSRGNLVIGWDKAGTIDPLYNIWNEMIVHDLSNHETMMATPSELKEFGVFCRLPAAFRNDE